MEKDKMKINGKSIMGIITLGAAYKSRIIISTDGPDENEAADAIEQLFLNRVRRIGGIMKELTARQREVLEFIKEYIEGHSYSPLCT